MRKRIWKKRWSVACGMVVLIVALNTAAWNSAAFSDWYIENIFPLWVNSYGRLTGIFPFSVGEWLIVAGLALVALTAAFAVVWAVAGAAVGAARIRAKIQGTKLRRIRELPKTSEESGEMVQENSLAEKAAPRLQGGFWRFSRGYYHILGWILLGVCLIMTLNCFVLYHASTFSEHYYGEDEEEYGLADVIAVYNMVAEECNGLWRVMERDEDGMVLYPGSTGADGEALDMADKARELMRQLGETYPQLDGYYPRPKAMFFSDFMCQQHMQGYYFPFSMEANYNDVMHILNIPSTMCHELAHLRGYIYEDEANFIAYLACVQSDEAFFRYAGYLSVLTYLNNDIYYAWRDNRPAYEEAVAVIQPVTVDEQVWIDNIFVTDEEWERINGKALIDTEVVDKAADVFIDTNLKVNGVADGRISYSRVVRLLLQYYKSKKIL